MKFPDASELSTTDRGFSYGDGVWETILVKQGEAQLLDQHLQRLQRGIDALNIQGADLPLLRQKVITLAAQQTPPTVLKIILTRGIGQRGYNPQGLSEPHCYLQVSPAPMYPPAWQQQGIVLGLCQTRLAHQPLLAGFKHLNRLEQVLARAEFEPHWQEALVLNYADQVIEGTMCNVFALRNGQLLTPDLQGCGIEGIMREQIIKVAKRMGVTTQIRSLSVQDIEQAESLFMTNSLCGLWPVREFAGKTYALHPMLFALQQPIKIYSL